MRAIGGGRPAGSSHIAIRCGEAGDARCCDFPAASWTGVPSSDRRFTPCKPRLTSYTLQGFSGYHLHVGSFSLRFWQQFSACQICIGYHLLEYALPIEGCAASVALAPQGYRMQLPAKVKGDGLAAGDNRHTARAIGDRLAIRHIHSECLPQDKAKKIWVGLPTFRVASCCIL